MQIFTSLTIKLIPLLIYLGLGFVGGKFLKISKESIAKLLIYLIVPFIAFNAGYATKITAEVFWLQVSLFLICTFICFVGLMTARIFFKDERSNLLGYAVSEGNSGYFGIPVALILFSQNQFNMYMLTLVGMTFFDVFIGIYVLARGRYGYWESVKRILKIPIMYGLVLGLILNYSGIQLGGVYDNFLGNITGAYSVLGIMLIGIGLAELKIMKIDYKFISFAMIFKFLFWPLVVGLVIYLDSITIELFSETAKQILLLISIVPLPGNSVVFASEFNIFPNKMAVAVFISTLFALIYIPVFVSLFF